MDIATTTAKRICVMNAFPAVYTRGCSIFVTPTGPFDRYAGFGIWEMLRPADWRCDWFVLDMVEVTELRDCRLHWLRPFLNWAKQTEMEICITNMPLHLLKRCEAFGIDLVDGEPRLRKRYGAATRPPREARLRTNL